MILLVKIELTIDTSKYEELGTKMPEVRKRGLNYTSQYMIERLQVHSPIDTGFLKGWFRYRESDSLVDIRSPAQYAIWQDQGTGPIKVKNKKALHWVKNGEHHFAKSTKGIKGKHFVEKSINETKGRLDSFFIKAIEDVL